MKTDAYNALRQWAQYNKADSLLPGTSQWTWKDWGNTRKHPTRRQGVQLRLVNEIFDPYITVWGIPTTPEPLNSLKVAIAEEYRPFLLQAIPVVMKQEHPNLSTLDAALLCELGFGTNGLYASADKSGNSNYEWRIVPAWEAGLNLVSSKLPSSLTIKGVGTLEVKSNTTGRKKIGDLCGYECGSSDPTWVIECVTSGPIVAGKSTFDSSVDLFESLTKTPNKIGVYRNIPEEYLRPRMNLLGNEMKQWVEDRHELPSFEGMLEEIIEEALLELLKKEEAPTTELPRRRS